MHHDFSSSSKFVIDAVVYVCAAVALVTWQQAAFAATVFAGVTGGALASIRIYHLIKYGPHKN